MGNAGHLGMPRALNPIRLTALFVLALAFGPASLAATEVENIRVWSEKGRTRVVLDLSQPSEHSIFTLRGPDRLVVDLKDGKLGRRIKELPDGVGSIRSIRTGLRSNGQLRVVLDLRESVRSRSFTAGPNDTYGDRLVIDLLREGTPQTVKRASEAYQSGRDVIIVVDPGHGGHDPGAIGRARTREKDVALAVSRRLAALINAEPGMRAVLTRSDDRYLDHRKRMEIARHGKADLFISVHADAVEDRRAKGASVYALSMKGASDEAARRLAQRENSSSRVGGVALEDKDAVLASVLLDLSQSAAIGSSLEAGDAVMAQLARVGTVHRRKVQQAGFLVLKAPDVPSILVELNYISNPTEEKKLTDRAQQNKLAEAITSGVRKYFYMNPPVDSRIAMDTRRTPTRSVRHVIERGDTLSELAERYNVSMSAIRNANKISGNNIRIGQTLQIPIFAGS